MTLADFLAAALLFFVPLLWGALGALLSARSGVLPLGLEGMMIAGALGGCLFLSAVETGDFSAVSRLRGIREITTRGDEGEIEFFCGGRGLVPASSYYGILYIPDAEDRELSQVFGDSPGWSAEGEGCRYRQTDGDNEFYYEPLGHGFFYYEEHF